MKSGLGWEQKQYPIWLNSKQPKNSSNPIIDIDWWEKKTLLYLDL